MQSNPNRITSSATKIRAAYGETCIVKNTPSGRVFMCCDKHMSSGFGHGGKFKHGSVKEYWRGESKLYKYSK